MRPLTTRVRAALLGAALAAGARLGEAQTVPAGTAPAASPPAVPARPAVRPLITSTLSTNLIALPFGVASAEGERAIGTRGFAVGVGALTTFGEEPAVPNDGGSEVFRSLQLKLKYYPREEGLRGFAVGVTAGVAHERQLLTRGSTFDGSGREVVLFETFDTRTAPTLGAVLDYNFLLGRQRRFLVGLGVGARRALGVGRSGALSGPLFDGRLQVGVGF